MGVPLSPYVTLVRRGQDCPRRPVLGDDSWQLGPSLFILGHFFLLGVRIRLDMKWAEDAKSFGPTIAPQNPAIRLLGRGGGF